MDETAESFVKLVLAVGQHDADYVDAYFGPEEWKLEAQESALSLEEIRQRATAALEALPATAEGSDSLTTARHRF